MTINQRLIGPGQLCLCDYEKVSRTRKNLNENEQRKGKHNMTITFNDFTSQLKVFHDTKETIKNVDTKGMGASIAQSLLEAHKENNQEILSFIASQYAIKRGERQAIIRTAEKYLSKALKVIEAMKKGAISLEDTRSVSSIYDALLAQEKEEKETHKAQGQVFQSETSLLQEYHNAIGASMTDFYQKTPKERLAITAKAYDWKEEQEAKAQKQALIENMDKTMFDIKTMIALVHENKPELLAELTEYLNSLTSPKTGKKAA